MSRYLTFDSIAKIAHEKHIMAIEMDFLVAKTRELNALRQQELDKLNALLDSVEDRLGIFSWPDEYQLQFE